MKWNWGIGVAVAGWRLSVQLGHAGGSRRQRRHRRRRKRGRFSDARRRLLRRRLGVRRRQEVDSVPGVPCSKPHDNEVYAVFDVTAASFPGDGMADMAHEACLERFEAFVGRDYESSSLDIASLYPSRESWSGQNDREVVCAVYDIDAKKLTGSVKGLGL